MGAALAAMLIWWFGTGLLLWLNRLAPRTFSVSLLGAMAAFGMSIAAIEVSQAITTPAAAYVAFAAGVTLWGCLELPHLFGWLTGPVREPCPDHLAGWGRFRRALGVGIYHDLAIIAVGSVLWLVLLDSPNQVAAWTFATLWLMRWSAKLNLFFGMPNLDLELVPERMRYLATYMADRPMNALFPISILGGLLLVWFHLAIGWSPASDFSRTAALLLATITGLAVLEHLLMLLPIRDSGLWRWAVMLVSTSKIAKT
ncbi:MAG: putative photosynthetic complex assembly protein PuhE [Pseudomonadota bacterium]